MQQVIDGATATATATATVPQHIVHFISYE